jgi:hypothetical protein
MRKHADGLETDDHLRLEAIAHELEPVAMTLIDDLPRDLPDALAARGLTLDPSARHPRYTLEDGFIRIELKGLEMVVQSRGGKPRKVAADPPAVADAAADLYAHLFGARPGRLQLEDLLAGYQRALVQQGLRPGEDVAIQVLREAVSDGKRLPPEDEFNVDLSRILDEVGKTGSVSVALSNTRDTKRGLLLHGLERAGYIGYLRIEGATL